MHALKQETAPEIEVLWPNLGVSDHAFDQYVADMAKTEGHKDLSAKGILQAVRAGRILDPTLARSLVGRHVRGNVPTLAMHGKSPRIRKRGTTRRHKPTWHIKPVEDGTVIPTGIYVLSQDHRGIFVIDEARQETIITYLRLSQESQEVVADL